LTPIGVSPTTTHLPLRCVEICTKPPVIPITRPERVTWRPSGAVAGKATTVCVKWRTLSVTE